MKHIMTPAIIFVARRFPKEINKRRKIMEAITPTNTSILKIDQRKRKKLL